MAARNIGLKVRAPRRSCEDERCPFHGHLSVRGRVLEGRVVSFKAPMMAVVERTYLHYVKKYERYERRRSKIHAHVPPCIELRPGDLVTIAECRPLAKTVSHVVVERREVISPVGA